MDMRPRDRKGIPVSYKMVACQCGFVKTEDGYQVVEITNQGLENEQ